MLWPRPWGWRQKPNQVEARVRNIYGKQVLETLGELVDPKHTAVLVVDTQDTGHADISCLRPG